MPGCAEPGVGVAGWSESVTLYFEGTRERAFLDVGNKFEDALFVQPDGRGYAGSDLVSLKLAGMVETKNCSFGKVQE